MNKQKILELTGMSEDQFYDMYPDQESFCSDYPEACAQLEQAQGGMQVGITYDRNGNPVNISPDVTPSNWQTVDGMYTRPHTVDRFGRPIAPMTQVTRTIVDRVPFNKNTPMDVISPLVARYTLPKGMVDNSKPIEKMTIPVERLTPEQTMRNIGSTGNSYSIPINKYDSIVDLLNDRGLDSSITSRKKIAEENNIQNYTGTATQNKLLLDIINKKNNNKDSIDNYNYLAPPKEKVINLNKYNSSKKIGTIADLQMKMLDGLNDNEEQKNKLAVKIAQSQNDYYKNYIYNAPKTLPCYGKGCAQLVSDELENMGLQPQRTNSWFMRDKVIKNGGVELWNKNLGKKINDYDLHVGDIVSMDRPGLHYEEEMKKNNPEKLTSEHNEHVGTVVGFTPQGKALIKHGGKDENTVIQPFDKLQLKNNITGAILNYKPISVYRVPGANKVNIKKEYNDYNYHYNPDMENPTKYSFIDYVSNRLGFETGGDVMIPEYKTGGHWIQGAVKHPGRCTPGSPNYDCPKGSPQWRLAQTFKKHHGFHEEGGTNIFPAMRNFKQGGYYGMDQKFHPNSDSGTYVGGAGYYFQPGGTATSASAPGTSGGVDISGVPGAGGLNADNSFAGDQFSDMSGLYGNDSFGVENQAYGEEDYAGNPYDESQQPMAYDPSQYSSEIDPSTGFTKYKKNGMALTKIKRQDPALWEHLKDEGHGARWRTGQTDIQRIGRAAGAIGQGLESAIDTAGAIGGYLSNRQKQQNLDKAAINMGSTASMITNPEGTSKGINGVTGSAYGKFKPNQMGNYSYTGMSNTAKYGKEILRYQMGGGFQNLFAGSQLLMPITNPMEFSSNNSMNNIPITNNIKENSYIPGNVKNSTRESNSDDSLKEMIAAKESGNNYKALPWMNKAHTKLASSAAGKYQFLWDTHKSDIKKVTGVKTKEDFLNSPDAQEEFFDYWDQNTLTPWANKIKSKLNVNLPVNKIKAAIHFSGPQGAWDYFSKGKQTKDAFRSTTSSYVASFQKGGQLGGQVVEMDENEIQQFLKAGGQLEFID